MTLTPSLNLRAKIVQILLAVQQGQSLAQILNQHLQHISPKDKALFSEILLGTLRQWFALKSLALPLLKKELNNPTVETCLYIGLYQILCTRIAHHACISETVEATKQLGYEGLSSVVNAILRKATRELDTFQHSLQQAHGLPSWLFKRLKKDWGDDEVQLKALFHQLKQIAPITLRVNQRHVSRETFSQRLAEQHIQHQISSITPYAIQLQQAVHIPDLIGFNTGDFMVQDEHAQLCADILPDLKNKIVIDACAAPGGKTTHILEKYDVQQLIALDNDELRLQRVKENLERLQLQYSPVQLITADATTFKATQRADCIILDAPCTATGVIRRHPDIRLLRKSEDVEQTVKLQKSILENMWQQLNVGGHLLYITCSILKAENEQQMSAFFARHQNAKHIPIQVHWGIEQQYGRQLLPQANGGDGFYYCLIEKV